MASVYARFRGSDGWEYQKVGRGRPPKDAKFHVRFTDSQGKRRWSQPFNTPQHTRIIFVGTVSEMTRVKGQPATMKPKLPLNFLGK
ncbi:MAG TPA: hypothetical protein VGO27_01680 [Candidatus Acidoferrum sp.]|nr:hypothetical protein [Candidatus Acidoferrum sp.]